MANPTTLLGAVQLLFSQSAAQADVQTAGGLWVGGAPEKFASYPFVALTHGGERPEWNFEGEVVEETGSFEFWVYAIGRLTDLPPCAAVETIASHIKAAFDPSSGPLSGQTPGAFVQLPMSGVTAAWVERQDYRVRMVEPFSGDDVWVFEARLPYKSFVAKLI